MVEESRGREAKAALESMGYQPEYKSYPMAHEVCLEQINDISAWLQARLS